MLSDRSFLSYDLSKRYVAKENQTAGEEAVRVLLCGGLAGVVTWASVFPLGRICTELFKRVSALVVLMDCARCHQDTRADLGPCSPA